MYRIEKRVKVMSWSCEFSLWVDIDKSERFRCEIVWVHTRHNVHLITFDCEGLEDAFYHCGELDQATVMSMVQDAAQMRLESEEKEWGETFGEPEW
jgi:hypothetical protein